MTDGAGKLASRAPQMQRLHPGGTHSYVRRIQQHTATLFAPALDSRHRRQCETIHQRTWTNREAVPTLPNGKGTAVRAADEAE
jgi:hypothetical protein